MFEVKKYIDELNKKKIDKIDWGLLIVFHVFVFMTMFYGDLKIIYHHSLTFLDTIFNLDMPNFYANTLANPCFGFGAVYYWMVYAVIAVWNLPVWILTRFFHVGEYAVPCLLWSKLQMVFFLLLTLWMLEKILKDFGFGKEKYRFAQFMFASSLFVVLPTVAIAQIDMITVFLMLWGIREYLNSDQITWKFLLIFSFAAAMKIFALFVFIPLVLLKEKRILYVIVDMIAGVICIALCLLPYAGREDYVQSTSILNDVMVSRMFSTAFVGGNTEIPAFLAILVALSIYAYAAKGENKDEYFYHTIWITLAVFAAFFIFVYAHPYWIVLLAPYIAIFLVMRSDKMKLNMILEFFISSCVSVYYCISFQVYMTRETFAELILKKLPMKSGEGCANLGEFIAKHHLEQYVSSLFMIFAVCLIAFLVINRPQKAKESLKWRETVDGALHFDHGMIYLRLFGIVMFIAGCIYLAYFSK